ncbi:MAG: hypothetical protein JXR03_11240 [Cyclobacteriaceae bacterium]
MRLHTLLFLILFTFVSTLGYSQYKPPGSRKPASKSLKGGNPLDRFYFGGGGGFSGGTDYVNLSVSPLIGYKITQAFSGGIQITYQYVKSGDFKISNYGGGPFLRYNVTEKFFGYTQYEYLNFGFIGPRGEKLRETFNSWFVGIGYTEPISDKFAFNITALYNVLYADGTDSPYQSPLLFRVGIVGGL